MRLPLWPRSLFGRLIAASVLALLVAQTVSLMLVARERERFVQQGNVHEWSRRIAEVSLLLQGMTAAERSATVAMLSERGWRFGRRPIDIYMLRNGLLPPGAHQPGDPAPSGKAPAPRDGPRPQLSSNPEFERAFEQQLQAALGPGYGVSVAPTSDAARPAVWIGGPLYAPASTRGVQLYDAMIRFPDGDQAVFRVSRLVRAALLPRNLFMNLALLLIVMVIALFVTARSITRPLLELARAADSVGRDLRQPRLAERGARELRDAARAFNTMQDRLQRYLDSRSRVLAAMSHDLKTPLTRLRLQVETLGDPGTQLRFGRQLDEMEGMVRGALALFRGLDDDEPFTAVEVEPLLQSVRSDFAEMGMVVTVQGHAQRPISGKPQALRRCLTNLIANAFKFGSSAELIVEDGPALVVRVRDEGPGIPPEELERVFEPFYRLESSRNRDTGGTGLGLSIARDIVQAHGGTLVLRNRPTRGLEAIITLPRTA